MTKAEIIMELEKFGIQATLRARKATLEALLMEKQQEALLEEMAEAEMDETYVSPTCTKETCGSAWWKSPCMIKFGVLAVVIIIISLFV